MAESISARKQRERRVKEGRPTDIEIYKEQAKEAERKREEKRLANAKAQAEKDKSLIAEKFVELRNDPVEATRLGAQQAEHYRSIAGIPVEQAARQEQAKRQQERYYTGRIPEAETKVKSFQQLSAEEKASLLKSKPEGTVYSLAPEAKGQRAIKVMIKKEEKKRKIQESKPKSTMEAAKPSLQYKLQVEAAEQTILGGAALAGLTVVRATKSAVKGATAIFRPSFYTKEIPETVKLATRVFKGEGAPEIGQAIKQDPLLLVDMIAYGQGFGFTTGAIANQFSNVKVGIRTQGKTTQIGVIGKAGSKPVGPVNIKLGQRTVQVGKVPSDYGTNAIKAIANSKKTTGPAFESNSISIIPETALSTRTQAVGAFADIKTLPLFEPPSYKPTVKKERLARAREQVTQEFIEGQYKLTPETPSNIRKAVRKDRLAARSISPLDVKPVGVFAETLTVYEPKGIKVQRAKERLRELQIEEVRGGQRSILDVRQDVRKEIRRKLTSEAKTPFIIKKKPYPQDLLFDIEQLPAAQQLRNQKQLNILQKQFFKTRKEQRKKIPNIIKELRKSKQGPDTLIRNLEVIRKKKQAYDQLKLIRSNQRLIETTDTLIQDKKKVSKQFNIQPSKDKKKPSSKPIIKTREGEEQITSQGQILILKPPKTKKESKQSLDQLVGGKRQSIFKQQTKQRTSQEQEQVFKQLPDTKQAQKSVSKQKQTLDQLVGAKSLSKASIKSENLQISKLKIVQAQDTKTVIKIKQAQGIVPKQSIKQVFKSEQKVQPQQKIISGQAIDIESRQVTKIDTVIKPKTSIKSRIDTRIIPNIEQRYRKDTIPRRVPFIFDTPKSNDKKKKYIVEVRRRGIFKEEFETTSIQQATAFGVKRLKTTAAASYRIKGLSGTQAYIPSKEFRRSKIDEDIIVQRRRFRISTPGEKLEISRKGQMARRKRR